MDPKEFDCEDCGVHVYSWCDDEATCCLVCAWIRSMPDLTEAEIAEIRIMTATPVREGLIRKDEIAKRLDGESAR